MSIFKIIFLFFLFFFVRRSLFPVKFWTKLSHQTTHIIRFLEFRSRHIFSILIYRIVYDYIFFTHLFAISKCRLLVLYDFYISWGVAISKLWSTPEFIFCILDNLFTLNISMETIKTHHRADSMDLTLMGELSRINWWCYTLYEA